MMPTFTAIALENFLEPNTRHSPPKRAVFPSNEHSPRDNNGNTTTNSNNPLAPSAATAARKPSPPIQFISPALYATPEPASIPSSSPTCVSPSPYVVNHKRRDIRRPSSTDLDVTNCPNGISKPKQETGVSDSENSTDGVHSVEPLAVAVGADSNGRGKEKEDVSLLNIHCDDGGLAIGGDDSLSNECLGGDHKNDVDGDFFDPRESMSALSSSDTEDGYTVGKCIPLQSRNEFYDAAEAYYLNPKYQHTQQLGNKPELLRALETVVSRLEKDPIQQAECLREVKWFKDRTGSFGRLAAMAAMDNTPPDFLSDTSVSQSSSMYSNIEADLRAVRLNLFEETEMRKKIEESLSLVNNQWQRIANLLSQVGLSFPLDMQVDADIAAHVYQEVVVTRFVSEAVERGVARAEAEAAAEDVIESKNREMARLRDRLQYYEAMNREMSQRNQEVTELARRQRQKRKLKRKWMWSCLGLSVAVGASLLAYSHFPHAGNNTLPPSDHCSDDSSPAIESQGGTQT